VCFVTHPEETIVMAIYIMMAMAQGALAVTGLLFGINGIKQLLFPISWAQSWKVKGADSLEFTDPL